jgi:pimeloyl-ACP methyl ester carboxylesterase
VLVNGEGAPVTVFAHGLAGSIDETRPFGSGVAGTRVFLHFRGHGLSATPDESFSYAALAAELAAVVDATAATQGLGVSLGAGALVRLAVERPQLFTRLVLVLPASLDRARAGAALDRVEAMAERADLGDVDGLTALLLAEQPAELASRRVVAMWARQQAERLVRPELARHMRDVPRSYPLDSADRLSRLTMPVLVVAQEGDEAHPDWLARELAEALPDARLEVFPPGGVVWSHRARLRDLLTAFLNC